MFEDQANSKNGICSGTRHATAAERVSKSWSNETASSRDAPADASVPLVVARRAGAD